MNKALKLVMVYSYVGGLVLVLVAAGMRLAGLLGTGVGYQAGNWGIGACALFLCALASQRMMDSGGK